MGVGSGIGGILGTAAGAYFGPAGMAIGSAVGGATGGLIDMFKPKTSDEIRQSSSSAMADLNAQRNLREANAQEGMSSAQYQRQQDASNRDLISNNRTLSALSDNTAMGSLAREQMSKSLMKSFIKSQSDLKDRQLENDIRQEQTNLKNKMAATDQVARTGAIEDARMAKELQRADQRKALLAKSIQGAMKTVAAGAAYGEKKGWGQFSKDMASAAKITALEENPQEGMYGSTYSLIPEGGGLQKPMAGSLLGLDTMPPPPSWQTGQGGEMMPEGHLDQKQSMAIANEAMDDGRPAVASAAVVNPVVAKLESKYGLTTERQADEDRYETQDRIYGKNSRETDTALRQYNDEMDAKIAARAAAPKEESVAQIQKDLPGTTAQEATVIHEDSVKMAAIEMIGATPDTPATPAPQSDGPQISKRIRDRILESMKANADAQNATSDIQSEQYDGEQYDGELYDGGDDGTPLAIRIVVRDLTQGTPIPKGIIMDGFNFDTVDDKGLRYSEYFLEKGVAMDGLMDEDYINSLVEDGTLTEFDVEFLGEWYDESLSDEEAGNE